MGVFLASEVALDLRVTGLVVRAWITSVCEILGLFAVKVVMGRHELRQLWQWHSTFQ